MFTLTDICDIAIQIERNGETVYRQAAGKSAQKSHARLFETLADQEKEHARWFERLQVDKPLAAGDQKVHDFGRELLQEMIAQQTFSLDADRLASGEEMEAIVDQSIEFEKDTILFYGMLSNFLENPEILMQLQKIIQEEHSHVDRLNEVKRKYNES